MNTLFIILSIVLIIIGILFLWASNRKDKILPLILICIIIGCVLCYIAGLTNLNWQFYHRTIRYYSDCVWLYLSSFLPFLGWSILKIRNKKLRLIVSIILTILSSILAIGLIVNASSSCFLYIFMYVGFLLITYSKLQKELVLSVSLLLTGSFGIGYAHLDNAYDKYLYRIEVHGNTYWCEDFHSDFILSSVGNVLVSKARGNIGIYEKDDELYFIRVYCNNAEDKYILKIYDQDGNYITKYRFPLLKSKDSYKISISDALASNDFECLKYAFDYYYIPDEYWDISVDENVETRLSKRKKSNYDEDDDIVEKKVIQDTESKSSSSYDEPVYTPQYETRDEWVSCWVCHGSGECDQCHGRGQNITYNPRGGSEVWKCPSCNGSGRCYTCGGTRGHYEQRTYQVR